MRQTLAIFYDAYRNLNARKLFWIVLVLSALVAGAFGCVGINEHGVKVLVWQLNFEAFNNLFNTEEIEPAVFYKMLFAGLGIGVWLAWLASILALISTAGIFPDLITGGSVHLLVSKPISRLRLFLTQYVAGLLFVTLQVALFTLASFLVIGLRGGAWEPGLFVAVPLVVCLFSYLFSVCVLLGLITRSTVASLLLTLLFWFFLWAVDKGEQGFLAVNFHEQYAAGQPSRAWSGGHDRVGAGTVRPEERSPRPRPAEETPTTLERGTKVPRAIGRAVLRTVTESSGSGETNRGGEMPAPPRWIAGGANIPKPGTGGDPLGDSNSDRQEDAPEDWKDVVYDIFYTLKTVLPKTAETVGLLERNLYSMADFPDEMMGGQSGQAEANRELAEQLRSRSLWWVLGTSLAFEAVVLGLAAWIFCRRDY